MDEESAIVVFRITQESLTNVLRYARADTVKILMKLESGHYCSAIQGNGFDLTAPKKTKFFGLLLGIRECSIMLSEKTCISRVPGNGTLMHIRISAKPMRQSL